MIANEFTIYFTSDFTRDFTRDFGGNFMRHLSGKKLQNHDVHSGLLSTLQAGLRKDANKVESIYALLK